MVKKSKQAIRIAVIGMDTRTRNLLKMVFNGPCKGDYLIIEDIQSAQACIFDLDTIDGMNFWEKHHARYSHLPTIVLSINKKEIARTFYVGKPIVFDHFVNTLGKIKKLVAQQGVGAEVVEEKSKSANTPVAATLHNAKLSTEVDLETEEQAVQWCGQLADIDPNNSEELHKVYYDPKQYMQSFLEKAWDVSKKSENKAILLDGLHTPMVIFQKNNQLFCPCSLEDHNLQTMALLPVAKTRLQMTVLTEKELDNYKLINKLFRNSLDSFLWQVSLWTARGRLPKGTDLNQKVILLHWPNFTRLLITPYALKISALWMSQPHSLLETAQVLEIPQRYVFAFYSAASAVKLTLLDRRVGQQPLHKNQLDRRLDQRSLNSGTNAIPKRGVLQRLLGRLHS